MLKSRTTITRSTIRSIWGFTLRYKSDFTWCWSLECSLSTTSASNSETASTAYSFLYCPLSELFSLDTYFSYAIQWYLSGSLWHGTWTQSIGGNTQTNHFSPTVHPALRSLLGLSGYLRCLFCTSISSYLELSACVHSSHKFNKKDCYQYQRLYSSIVAYAGTLSFSSLSVYSSLDSPSLLWATSSQMPPVCKMTNSCLQKTHQTLKRKGLKSWQRKRSSSNRAYLTNLLIAQSALKHSQILTRSLSFHAAPSTCIMTTV